MHDHLEERQLPIEKRALQGIAQNVVQNFIQTDRRRTWKRPSVASLSCCSISANEYAGDEPRRTRTTPSRAKMGISQTIEIVDLQLATDQVDGRQSAFLSSRHLPFPLQLRRVQIQSVFSYELCFSLRHDGSNFE